MLYAVLGNFNTIYVLGYSAVRDGKRDDDREVNAHDILPYRHGAENSTNHKIIYRLRILTGLLIHIKKTADAPLHIIS